MIINTYSVILYIVTILQIFLFMIIWPKRNVRGGVYLAGFAASSGFWAFAGAFEMAVVSIQTKVLWSAVSYAGVCTSPVFFFLFVLHFTQINRFIRKKHEKYFWIIPVVTVVAALTNSWHFLLWRDFTWSGGNVLVYWYGPLFWANSLYVYLLMAVGIVLLIYNTIRYRDVYRRQLFAVSLASFTPFAVNFVYILKIEPLIGYDLTPASFLFTTAALAWILFRYDFLDLVPVAHDLIVSRMKAGILILDPVHRIVEINGAMKRIFDSCDTCIGQPVDVLAKQHEGLVSICRENSYYEGEITLDAESPHYFDINISEIFDSNRQLLGKIVMLYDITHKKQIEKQLVRKNALLEDRVFEVEKLQEKLSEQALKDPLTGLFNRRFLAEVVEKEASRARRESSTFGLCMIDIDNFKSVNDRFGHDAGDYVLMRVSDTMSSLMRRTDYLCRFGGDELIIILPKIGKQDAVVKAEQLCNALSRINFEIAGERIEVTLSIGIALFPEDGSSFEQLMQKADAALYNSKRCGRNRITVYDSSLKP